MSENNVRRDSLINRIYGINEKAFEAVALDVWRYQYEYNPLYQKFCDTLGIQPLDIDSLTSIPFLPITLFRDHMVKSGIWETQTVFKSSGTTGSVSGSHHIRDLNFYHQIAERCFTKFFGPPDQYAWIGLLPSYLERPDSSLVDMVQFFMKRSGHAVNGFYSGPDDKVVQALHLLAGDSVPTMLIGVSFALLDLFEQYEIPLWPGLHVIETGGMKGRRAEITREELHARMSVNNPGLTISSEYGMTELLSQAYSQQNIFLPGPTMKVCIRDISDPMSLLSYGQRGVINVIDLGNLDTCAFIATEDIGIGHEGNSFEVLGRLDQSDLRGCNLMYS